MNLRRNRLLPPYGRSPASLKNTAGQQKFWKGGGCSSVHRTSDWEDHRLPLKKRKISPLPIQAKKEHKVKEEAEKVEDSATLLLQFASASKHTTKVKVEEEEEEEPMAKRATLFVSI